MKKILHLGLKEWPCGASKKFKIIGPVGVDLYVDNLLSSLSNKFKFFVACRRFPGQEKKELHNNIHIQRYPFFNGTYISLLSMGIFSFFYGLSLVKKNKIDIIHGHDFFGIVPAFFISKITNTRLIGTSHGYYVRAPKTSNFQHFLRIIMDKLFVKKIFPKMNNWVFLNENEKNNYQRIVGKSLNESKIIYNGIDVKKFQFKRNPIKANILFVGRLVPIKAIDRIIESMVHILKKYDYAELNIVGDGFQRNFLKNLVRKLNINEKVIFHGWQTDLNEFYSKADIFLLPSYAEGAPSALYEAMACGIPSIVGNLDLAPSDSVIRLSDNKPEDISEAVISLLENREKMESLSLLSKKVSSKLFNRIWMSKEHEILYNNVN